MTESPSLWSRFAGDVRGRALWVLIGCLVCQMGLGFGYVVGALAGNVIDEFGWTRTMFSSARAPQTLVIAAASPLVGALVIRHGARWILAGGVISLAAGTLLMSAMQELWHFAVLVVPMGLAIAALGDVSVGQVVTGWVARGRGLALGLVYSGSNIGGALFVALAAEIATHGTWRASFAALGVGALLVMLPAALFVVREPASNVSAAGARPPDVLVGSDRDLNLVEALRTRSFWILAFTLFTFFFYFLAVLEHLVLYLTDSGMERTDASLYFSYSLGLGIASKLGLGAIADRMPHRASTLLVYGVLTASAVALLALPMAEPRDVALWLFIATFAFSTASRDVIYPLIITECFGVRYLAQIYGTLMVALLPGGVLGGIFAAAIHDRFGSYALAFETFLALNALSFTALLFVRRESRPGAAGTAHRQI